MDCNFFKKDKSQKSALKLIQSKNKKYNDLLRNPPEGTSEMLSMISTLQSDRLNDQRAELRPLNPQPRPTMPGAGALHTTRARPEDDFIEVLARVQGTRLEDQRTALPAAPREAAGGPAPPTGGQVQEPEDGEEDFFSRLMKAQSGRMEDQRASIPLKDKSQASNSKQN